MLLPKSPEQHQGSCEAAAARGRAMAVMSPWVDGWQRPCGPWDWSHWSNYSHCLSWEVPMARSSDRFWEAAQPGLDYPDPNKLLPGGLPYFWFTQLFLRFCFNSSIASLVFFPQCWPPACRVWKVSWAMVLQWLLYPKRLAHSHYGWTGGSWRSRYSRSFHFAKFEGLSSFSTRWVPRLCHASSGRSLCAY